MIEVIYKDERQDAEGDEGSFTIPRNIRQIGLVNEAYRIYMEDYVYTFLGRLAASGNAGEKQTGSLAVLTGETGWREGVSYLFIRGAIMVEEAEAAPDHIDFSEKIWGKIHEDQEKYFPGQEITGWFFSYPQLPMEATELLEKIHLRHFGGEKVLMLIEPGEREEAFFRYENGHMAHISGYYIYYEKNPQMQEYMIEKNQDLKPEPTEQVEDEAVKAFRKIILGKKSREPEKTEEHTSVFSYAATACLVVAVLAVGASFYRNYRSLRHVEEQAASASALVVQDGADTGELLDGQPSAALSVTPALLQAEETEPVKAPEAELTAEPAKAPEAEAPEAETPEAEAPETEVTAEQTETEETGSQESTSEIYKEESDIRKAKRREAMAALEGQAGIGDAAVQSAEAEEQASAGAQSAEADGAASAGAQMAETGDALPADPASAEQETAAQAGNHEMYVIRPGDTLYQISISRYGNMDSISEICRLNNLAENQIIYPGQVIVLP